MGEEDIGGKAQGRRSFDILGGYSVIPRNGDLDPHSYSYVNNTPIT